ncbi:hypothetical protein PV325_012898 [Microctonus aethiopoides]|uniref:Transferrin n=1 Tax=Microctonus aethiopoides TaxID=144406 RepID=A0AA39F8P6_9HYME|nr:hypothetical protein PV325_012898 [Microctonus aethiopoides]KAK0164884.1 hypothetical protein PV328_003451 [Microctonus aethiopoides]
MGNFFIILLLIVTSTLAEQYRLCTPESISNSDIASLTKGNSQISCVPVTDSADCAIKINENKADFGIFNAEELLLAYQFYPDSLLPIIQLKHEDKINEEFEFRTVAVVPDSINSNEGLAALKDGGLCHPGFSESQIWNDYILKFFEKKVHKNQCNRYLSVSENDAYNIRHFFGKACRPGNWVNDPSYDSELKKKYPELCALCNNQKECKYDNNLNHGHMGALDCLTSNRGRVAYVAYHYVQQYFKIDHNNPAPNATPTGYQFLCPNGALQPLTVSNPCAWIQQPWSAIVTRKDNANLMITNLKNWLQAPLQQTETWTIALGDILQRDGKIVYLHEQPTLKSYLVKGREVDLNERPCGHDIRWCTVNEPERIKCQWVAKEALLLGIQPRILCELKNSTFDCLLNISKSEADIMTIDSNYGYLARRIYNLTTVLYTETERQKNSVVVAIVRNDVLSVKNFQELKNKRVCFPDYGGIAWVSFINTLRINKIIEDTNDYPRAIAELLVGACTPGINDTDHSDVTNSYTIEILCASCPLEGSNDTCSAHISNQYYGDNGALKCLAGPGDIAIIESKNVEEFVRERVIYPGDFRVLCKNGSLAGYSGFDVDDDCALSVTIDSEIVGRKYDLSDFQNNDTTDALLKIEDWLGYRPYSRRAIRIYESFKGYHDLLFKDSTVGLESIDSNLKSIVAYKELFQFMDSEHSSVCSIVSNFILIFVSATITLTSYYS